MSIFFLLTSFIAGILTILAPCVLPLLPIMIGGSIGSKSYSKPLVITLSLALSIIIFTLVLKVSSVFISIPQDFWKLLSGGLLIIFGISMIFPQIWTQISLKLGFESGSQKLINKASEKQNLIGDILLGASLGPVFSSCSPTYFIILATVLPASFFSGLIYLISYAIGLSLVLFLIGIFGQKLTKKVKFAANPKGNFRKIIGIIILIVGLSIISGLDKKLEAYLIGKGLGTTRLEEFLIETAEDKMENETMKSGDEVSVVELTENDPLPKLYEAPELIGLENWINSEEIKSIKDLKGKVVLIDFWTYSCINCIRTLPYIQSWHEKYSDDGLVIIGIHAPEFQFEKKIENVEEAVKEYGLTYPVVQDNDFETWRAYKNHYWPAKYLIDKEGFVRYTHFGEGEYSETEKIIVELLGTQMEENEISATKVDFKQIKSPETYIGLERRANFVQNTENLRLNEWTLIGEFEADEEKSITKSTNASIKMRFKASKANLVMGGNGNAEVYIDGIKIKDIQITGDKLYEVANFGENYEEHEIEIKFLNEGIELYAWTFG